jgi:hypothetical protein
MLLRAPLLYKNPLKILCKKDRRALMGKKLELRLEYKDYLENFWKEENKNKLENLLDLA